MPNRDATVGRREFLGALGGGSVAATAGCLEADGSLESGVLEDADGPVDVLVQFEGAALPDDVVASEVVPALRRHAERSHAAFREFTASTAGVDLRREFWLADAVLATVDPDAVALEDLAGVRGVEAVHPNRVDDSLDPVRSSTQPSGAAKGGTSGSATGGSSSTAAASGSQSSGQPQETDVTYALDQIHAAPVWEIYGARGGGVDVAVLDSGVDPAGHDGIAGSLERGSWAEFDVAGERVESEPYDPNGHGTGVSGLVVGGTNDEGVQYGVAPEAALYHAKIYGEDGFYLAQLLAGLEWAVEQGVDVVSMSIGPIGYPGPLVEPFENARQSGVLVVGSVGNAGQYTSASPGNFPTTVGVGAVDRDGQVTDVSGGERVRTQRYWGPAAPDAWPDEYTVPDVVAAGVDVPSAEPGGGSGQSRGASAATPIVAGVAALARSAADDPSLDALEAALTDSALHPAADDDFDVDPGEDDRYGSGVASATFATTELVADQTVAGIVQTADGRPMPHVDVLSEIGAWTTTDAEGRFELQLPDFEVPIGALPVGYDPDVAMVDPTVTDEVELTPQRTDAPAAVMTERTPLRIESGQTANAAFTVANVEAVTVNVWTDVMLQPGDLELRIDGEPASFDETIQVDASERTGDFRITVTASEGAGVGPFVANVAFHGGEETVSGELHEVRVHPDPIRIESGTLPSLQGPIDLVAPGTTIELGDGRFDQPLDGEVGALDVDEPVSIVAAPDAAPHVVPADADPERPALYVAANDVELSGIGVEAGGAAAAIQLGTEPRDRETDAPSATTVTDATVRGAATGIDVRTAPAARIRNSNVTAEDVGISIGGVESTFVTGNEVHDVETGIVGGGLVTEVSENRLRQIGGAAIRLELPRDDLERVGVDQGPIRANVIEGAAIGIEVAEGAATGEIEGNEFTDVDAQIVGVDGSGAAPGDSTLDLVLYGLTGLSIGVLFVPYARRKLRR